MSDDDTGLYPHIGDIKKYADGRDKEDQDQERKRRRI